MINLTFVVVRHLLEWEKRKCQRTITDSLLLRKLMMFLADNIGNSVSANSTLRLLKQQLMLINRLIVEEHYKVDG